MNWKFLFTWNLCKSLRTLNVIKNNSTVTTTSSFLKCERQLCKHKHFFWVFQMISQFCENFPNFFISSIEHHRSECFCRPTVNLNVAHLLLIILCVSCPWYYSSVCDFFGFREMNAPQKRREKHLNLLWKVQRTALLTLVTDCRLIIKQ